MNRKIRMGMVGGGPDAFIGPIHRLAAELDGEIELVAGAFARDRERSVAGGARYGIGPERSYATLDAMIAAEASRADGIEMLTIATPNRHHLTAARAAIAAGLAVMSDKPMTGNLTEAIALAALVRDAGTPFAVTYTYSGYPMVREARARVAAGAIGTVRKVVVEYPQGWLAGPADGKQAAWRIDPAQAGIGGCIADIGVHAFHLAEFVTGLRTRMLLADLGAVVPGRALDDDCTLLLRFGGGARGVLMASQISVGERNGLRVRVYGDMGGLDWRQEDPERLWQHDIDGGTRILHRGDPGLNEASVAATRTPAGHPEGYLEAFANLYRDFAKVLRGGAAPLLPGVTEGLRSMALIDTAVAASRDNVGWVELHTEGERS